MIFSELYSAYYNTVAQILAKIISGEKSQSELQKIVSEKAFGESALTILPALKTQKWQLVNEDFSTPIKHAPTMPLTLLQKRWLKAISLDARVKLFDVKFEGLEEVEPLFTPEDYCIFDKYTDGDNFEDEAYIRHFKTLLSAIKNGQAVRITFLNRSNEHVTFPCYPEKLEYSEKDDKFRLIIPRSGKIGTINLAKITSCKICYDKNIKFQVIREPVIEELVLKIKDYRNAMERCMLHFAHFEKRAEKISDNEYILYIKYDAEDRSELVVRVLSFGPMVEALAPQVFRDEVIKKLKKQMKYLPLTNKN